MGISFLTHAFGLSKQEFLKEEFKSGEILFHIQTKPSELRCCRCNSYKVKKRGFKIRTFKSIPIGFKPTKLVSKLRRLHCFECGALMQEKIRFADENKTYTRQMERFANELCEIMTIQDVAKKLGLGWDTVKAIRKEHLENKYAKINLKDLTILAIDEISIRKGHKYITLVMDLETGAIVFVGDGKGSESLVPFWKLLKRSGANIEAISIDMSPAYILAIETNLPTTKIIFDHFHIVKLLNENISALRRDVYKNETDSKKKRFSKGHDGCC